MPAWVFGHQRKCWQMDLDHNGKKDPVFAQMEGDLVNLVPAIGEINGDRSNYSFTGFYDSKNGLSSFGAVTVGFLGLQLYFYIQNYRVKN